MKRAAVLAILIIGAFPAVAAGSDAISYESFRIVIERNIFDPGRTAARPGRPEVTVSAIAEPVRNDRFFLYGALIYEGTAVAFFSGTRDEYNLAARKGGSIAGYRVVEIRTQSVALEIDGERVDLPVGSGLSRQSDGQWAMTSEAPVLDRRPEAGRERNGEGASQQADARSEAGETESPSASDLMQRMMERRRRELER